MARMGKCHLCSLFLALFMILVSLGLLVAAIVTDFWYEVDATHFKNETIVEDFSYTIGMWRKCYTNGIPESEPVEDRQGSCVFTYKDWIRRTEDDLPSDEYRYLNLGRSWIGLGLTAAGVQLFTVLALICGLWPGDCNSIKRSSMYLTAAIMSLLAAMAGIASGICFIALRDLDETSREIYPTENGKEVGRRYMWSFMLCWAGNSLCMLEGFIFLCLLRVDYDDVAATKKYQTM